MWYLVFGGRISTHNTLTLTIQWWKLTTLQAGVENHYWCGVDANRILRISVKNAQIHALVCVCVRVCVTLVGFPMGDQKALHRIFVICICIPTVLREPSVPPVPGTISQPNVCFLYPAGVTIRHLILGHRLQRFPRCHVRHLILGYRLLRFARGCQAPNYRSSITMVFTWSLCGR